MHPILANRDRLLVYLISWLPIAALLTAILGRGTELSWVEALIIAGPMCFFYAFMCLAAWYLCRTSALQNRATIPMIGILAAATLFSSTLWVLLGQTWAAALEVVPQFSGLAQRYTGQAAVLFFSGVLLFLLAVAVHYLLLMLEESRAAEKHALQFQVLARDAELRALRAQIDPHFLFNSLNSISALAVPDPAAARRMSLLLADFMRTSLAVAQKNQIAFSEEMNLIRAFLDIEEVRFGERLRVQYDVMSECKDCLVPPLLIQPLVENAVTHGVAPLIDGGTISVAARERQGALEITIANPYDVDALSNKGSGLGIRNVRERLANFFGDQARVEVHRNEGTFRIELRLPCIRNGVLR